MRRAGRAFVKAATTGWSSASWTPRARRFPTSRGATTPPPRNCGSRGLHEGDYRLLVLGIRGDAAADGVTVRPIRHLDEEWLTFPETLDSPLAAEYFYSQTPLRWSCTRVPTGTRREVILAGEVVQRRIVGRVDFSISFRNPYVGAAFVSSQVAIEPCRIRTGLTGGGELTGEGTVQLRTLAPGRETAWLLPPTVGGYGTAGRG